MNHRLLTMACLAASLGLGPGAPGLAQSLLARVNEEAAAERDDRAVDALTRSAETASRAPFTATLVATSHVVAGPQEQTQQSVYTIAAGEGGRFAVDQLKPQPMFSIRSDGKKTLTVISPPGGAPQFSLAEESRGLGGFIETPLAQSIGNGVGSLALSVLTEAGVKQVLSDTKGARVVGEEKDGEAQEGDEKDGEADLLHCQYETGGLTWDAWFTVGEAPVLRRLKPDLSPMIKRTPAARQFENFKYELAFELTDLTNKVDPQQAFALRVPEGAEYADDLFGQPMEPPHPLLGKEAPAFTLEGADGKTLDLGEAIQQKKIVILDFWATWCGPCVEAMPIIHDVAEEFAGKDVLFYAVNVQEEAEQVTEFLKSNNLEVTVPLDADGAVSTEYGVEGLPTSVLIGKDGRVQVVHVGLSGDLRERLTKELDELVAGKDLAQAAVDEWTERRAAQQKRGDEVRAQLAQEAQAAGDASPSAAP